MKAHLILPDPPCSCNCQRVTVNPHPPALCRRLGCDYLLVLMNTEVFFILLKKSLLHIPWVAGVKAHVTTTKSDSSASLVSGTEWRKTSHSFAWGISPTDISNLLYMKSSPVSTALERPFSTNGETQGPSNTQQKSYTSLQILLQCFVSLLN